LTTTAPEQGKVVEALKETGLRDKVKIMVGGGTITQGFDEGVKDNAGQRIRSQF